jgi:hypothetical protein
VKPAAETPKVEEVKQEDTTPKVSVYVHNRKHSRQFYPTPYLTI